MSGGGDKNWAPSREVTAWEQVQPHIFARNISGCYRARSEMLKGNEAHCGTSPFESAIKDVLAEWMRVKSFAPVGRPCSVVSRYYSPRITP